MTKLDEIIGDLIFLSFGDVERYKDIGITKPSGHFLLKGYDQMGLWLEHPGIVIFHTEDEEFFEEFFPAEIHFNKLPIISRLNIKTLRQIRMNR